MNKRNIIIGIIVTALLIVAAVIYFIIPRSYIKFETAPQQVSVLIDGKNKYSITNGDTISITPGNHTVSVSQDEFGPYIKEINIKNRQTNDFLVALKPLTDAAKGLLTNNDSDAIVQRFYGKIYIQQTDNMTKNYPILGILPIQARLYIISACPSKQYPDDQTKIALCVDTNQSGLEPYILEDIQSRGYNPSDYEIIWSITPL